MLINWLAQFALFCGIIFFSGFGAIHGLVALDLSPQRMVEIYGFADAGSYLQAALSLIDHSSNVPEWQWVLNLWPPGMVWLDALIIAISPLSYGVTLGLITAAVWATCFAVLTWPLMTSKLTVAVVFAVEMAVLGSSPFQSWMLDEGFFYADGLAAASFLLGLAIVVNRAFFGGAAPFWVRDGIFAGIAIAAAVYFRASYNLVPWVMGAVALVIAIVVVATRRSGKQPAARRHSLGRQALILGTATVTTLLLFLPYSSYLLQTRDRAQFVQTEDLVYEHVWEDPDFKKIPQWMLDGGSTIGCDLDELQCAAFEEQRKNGDTPSPAELRDAVVAAIISNPAEFTGNRVSAVVRQWFGDELTSYSRAEQDHESGSVTYSGSYNFNPPQGALYLALLVASFIFAIGASRKGHLAALVVPLSALALLAPFALVHVEVRYLIPLKLIGLLAPTLYLMSQKRTLAKSVAVESSDAPMEEVSTHA